MSVGGLWGIRHAHTEPARLFVVLRLTMPLRLGVDMRSLERLKHPLDLLVHLVPLRLAQVILLLLGQVHRHVRPP